MGEGAQHLAIVSSKHNVYLGVVGLLQFLLVEFHLKFMLASHLHQSISQFAFKVLLVAVVQLHHAGLVAPLEIAQLLRGEAGHENEALACAAFFFFFSLHETSHGDNNRA